MDVAVVFVEISFLSWPQGRRHSQVVVAPHQGISQKLYHQTEGHPRHRNIQIYHIFFFFQNSQKTIGK